LKTRRKTTLATRFTEALDDESASQDGSIDSFDPSKVISETKKKILDRDPTPNPGSPRAEDMEPIKVDAAALGVDEKAFASPTASDGPSGTVTPSDGVSEASSDAGSNASSPAFPTRNVA